MVIATICTGIFHGFGGQSCMKHGRSLIALHEQRWR